MNTKIVSFTVRKQSGSKHVVFDRVYHADATGTAILLTPNLQRPPSTAE